MNCLAVCPLGRGFGGCSISQEEANKFGNGALEFMCAELDFHPGIKEWDEKYVKIMEFRKEKQLYSGAH